MTSATLPPSTYWRDSDLLNTQNACQAHAEKILTAARLPAECVRTIEHGLQIEQAQSSRRWQPDPKTTQHCHLVDKSELDPTLGIYALATRTISPEILVGHYVAVCSWHHLPAVAEYLRSDSLCEALKYFGLEKHLVQAVSALGLQELPVNHQPPGYSMTRHGALLRFDLATVPIFNRYFILDETFAPTEPVSIKLGGGCYLVYVHSGNLVEPLRAMIVNNSWSVSQAAKELQRWHRATANIPRTEASR